MPYGKYQQKKATLLVQPIAYFQVRFFTSLISLI
jgi:hypothetical protein